MDADLAADDPLNLTDFETVALAAYIKAKRELEAVKLYCAEL